jgi:basic membrane protein A
MSAAESASLQRNYAKSKQDNLIICIGPSHSQSLRQLSLDFPKQQFTLVDGDIADRANISSLVSRDNESSFLAGAVAAMVSQTNQIGFIGGMDVTAIHRFLAGYQAGAQYINPECKVIVAYAGTWANDGKTKALALQQYQQGADIIFGPTGAGSIGVIEAAKEKNLYAIGVDTDQSTIGPRNVLASTVKNVDVAILGAMKLSIEEKFSGGIQTSGLKEGGVGIVVNNTLSIITPEIKERITEIEKKIISGDITVPEE